MREHVREQAEKDAQVMREHVREQAEKDAQVMREHVREQAEKDAQVMREHVRERDARNKSVQHTEGDDLALGGQERDVERDTQQEHEGGVDGEHEGGGEHEEMRERRKRTRDPTEKDDEVVDSRNRRKRKWTAQSLEKSKQTKRRNKERAQNYGTLLEYYKTALYKIDEVMSVAKTYMSIHCRANDELIEAFENEVDNIFSNLGATPSVDDE
jgi:hypothetical protein